MNKLYICRGLPASGKSTWARKFVFERDFKAVRLNRDDFRQMAHNGVFSSEREFIIRTWEQTMAAQALFYGYDVVIDDTNLANHAIAAFLQIAAVAKRVTQLVVFGAPPELCIVRDAHRAFPVGKEVIERLHAMTEPLSDSILRQVQLTEV